MGCRVGWGERAFKSGCKEREKRKRGESKRVSIKVKDRQEEDRDGGLKDRVALYFSM